MSYPIPHFRDADDASLLMRAEMAEAELAHLRQRQPGIRRAVASEETIMPAILTMPPLRQHAPIPMPAFQPSFIPVLAEVPDGYILTPTGLRPKA